MSTTPLATPRRRIGRTSRSRASRLDPGQGAVSREYQETKALNAPAQPPHVCEEAGCPNIGECWKQKHATVMILGSICTRACAFCNVATGKPLASTRMSRARAEAVGELGSPCRGDLVDRDDLDDGGAGHFAGSSRRSASGRRAPPSRC